MLEHFYYLCAGIVFGDQSYVNNSVILFNTTGTLHCYFDKSGRSSCNIEVEVQNGSWLFPNRTLIGAMSDDDIYSSTHEGEVRLIWKKDVVIPAGIFCCEASDPKHTFCIGVYPEGEGDS